MARYLSKEFIQYCKENKLEKVRSCLNLEVDVNTVSVDNSWSGLTIAAHKNYLDLLDLLLSHPDIKINLTTKNSEQSTALMFACISGNPAIVSRLVEEEQLDINHQNQDGNTAAHLAIAKGHTECLRLLAGTGKVDFNIKNKWGNTPLFRALFHGHTDIVDILLKIPGIDFNVKTETGRTLARAAVRGGVLSSVESLASQEKFDCWNIPDENGNTPVMKALRRGKTDIVRVLVDCPRVDLTIRDKEGWTLVMEAIAGKELGEC